MWLTEDDLTKANETLLKKSCVIFLDVYAPLSYSEASCSSGRCFEDIEKYHRGLDREEVVEPRNSNGERKIGGISRKDW